VTHLLEREVAVVTGAGKGIGEAIAGALAGAGARVAVTSRRQEDAERVAAGLGSEHMGVEMDVSSSEGVEKAVALILEALGEPTVLVNNAGVNRIGPAESYTDEDWELVLDTNLAGVFRTCRAFGSRMLVAGRGTIVNVASVIGPVVGAPGRVAYAASQGGVVGLTRTLGVEWAGRGVRVNAVLPGPVLTPMVQEAIDRGIIDPADVVGRTPAGRFGLGDDIARAVVLLCSNEAGFVAGQTLVVDGGYTAYGAAHPGASITKAAE
jgi:NAD(P)-dependent dehydrogenase (short-subunit alcohol dehydrogenase family)